ncbi:alpha/beta hydrolase [Streptomyces millisiae]|uniref:Alpha/beta hydrolase n=1 Tax=Streptomyces millisiae TaxID=3075542 RepID=A0ABU2LUA8_9ACTN|nr:alpha/beta hydrolase [Streptomyces sp. DSM 44918]MDT0321191.1 alpha/beta hydrolase [Streptomyces sp. DSM 44918]
MPVTDNHIFDLDEDVTRTPVSYHNRFGITLAANLYRPKDFDESRRYPAVIIGPPHSAVKEQGSGIYAQNMAKRGFVALAFDPSFNGYSGGEPRHVTSPEIFVEDFSASVDYLGTRPFVDREGIGVIGICGSGGFGISAAQVDRRVKAVATASMYDISRIYSKGYRDSFTEEERIRILDELAEQRYADFEAGHPALAPRQSIGVAPETNPIGAEFSEFYTTPQGYHHNAPTQFTLTSTMAYMNFSLPDHIKTVSPRPLLFITGEHAHSRYFSEDAYELAAEPKELAVVPGANHVDLYDRTDLIPFDKLDEFFTKNLA